MVIDLLLINSAAASVDEGLGKYRARYMRRSMPGTTLAGQWVTVTALPGVNIYTHRWTGPVGCLGKRLLYAHNSETQTNRMLSINDTRGGITGLVWSGVSKVKKWHTIIWALAQTDMTAVGWTPPQKARVSRFFFFFLKREYGAFQIAGPVHLFIFCHWLETTCMVLGVSYTFSLTRGKKWWLPTGTALCQTKAEVTHTVQ